MPSTTTRKTPAPLSGGVPLPPAQLSSGIPLPPAQASTGIPLPTTVTADPAALSNGIPLPTTQTPVRAPTRAPSQTPVRTLDTTPVRTFNPEASSQHAELQAAYDFLMRHEGKFFGLDAQRIYDLFVEDKAAFMQLTSEEAANAFLSNDSKILSAYAAVISGYAVLSDMKNDILTAKTQEGAMDAAALRTLATTLEAQLMEVLDAPSTQARQKVNALLGAWEQEYGVKRLDTINNHNINTALYPEAEWSSILAIQAATPSQAETRAPAQVEVQPEVAPIGIYAYKTVNQNGATFEMQRQLGPNNLQVLGAVNITADGIRDLESLAAVSDLSITKVGDSYRLVYNNGQVKTFDKTLMATILAANHYSLSEFDAMLGTGEAISVFQGCAAETARLGHAANVVDQTGLTPSSQQAPRKKNWMQKVMDWLKVILIFMAGIGVVNSLLGLFGWENALGNQKRMMGFANEAYQITRRLDDVYDDFDNSWAAANYDYRDSYRRPRGQQEYGQPGDYGYT